ncbi:hypothetical protein [Psychromonas antarctica]|uniref:hypothetical protein n=1 Tax=Psychromonas antarctica TaxID=67573 RepID=UPI001EE7FE68|nr:hypothetical protein [Psychromonas antarctica]MCG6200987.1 hypothetical protein [Psychromonas antarctica]
MKKQINLYQPSCYPRREKFTFKHFLLLVAVSVLSLILLQFILNKQLSRTKQIEQQQQAILATKQNDLSDLVIKLQNNRAPDAKVRQQLALQEEVDAKQRILGSLAGIEFAVVVNFSALMKGLSLASMDAISIDYFSLLAGRLNISGQAKRSDSVPLWLSKIQSTKELSGIAFEKLAISENAGGFFFQLSNSLENKSVKVRKK